MDVADWFPLHGGEEKVDIVTILIIVILVLLAIYLFQRVF
jgi:hypothetical protein